MWNLSGIFERSYFTAVHSTWLLPLWSVLTVGVIRMPTQLERELSMVPTGLKKSKSKLGDGSGLADRGDPANDDTCDPIMEKKILDKIVALKKRLVFWTRKMAESVSLKIRYLYSYTQYYRSFIIAIMFVCFLNVSHVLQLPIFPFLKNILPF